MSALGSGLSWQWMCGLAEFEAAGAKWNEALDRAHSDNPFLRSEFLVCWARAFQRQDVLRVLVVKDTEQIVAGLALVCTRSRWGYHVLEPAGTHFANLTEPFLSIPTPTFEQVFSEALRGLSGWSTLLLPRMRQPLAITHAARARIRAFVRQTDTTGWISLDARHAIERESSGGNERRGIRRALRRFAKSGNISFEQPSDETALAAAVETFIEFSVESQRSRGRPSVFESPEWAAFVGTLVAEMAPSGALEVFILRIDDTPAAIAIMLRQGHVVHGLWMGFSPAFASRSPGTTLMSQLITEEASRGATAIALGGGVADLHKRAWATHTVPTYELRAFHGGSGRMLRLMWTTLRTLRSHA